MAGDLDVLSKHEVPTPAPEVLIPEARRLRRRRWLLGVGVVGAVALAASALVVLTSSSKPSAPARPPFGLEPSQPVAAPITVVGGPSRCRGGSGLLLPGFGGESLFGAPLPGGASLVGYQISGVSVRGLRQAPVVLEELNAGCAPVRGFGPGGKVTLAIPFPDVKVDHRTGAGGEAFIGSMTASLHGDVIMFGNYGSEIIGAEVSPQGRLVTSFGDGGWTGFVNRSVSSLLTNVTTVATRPDGSILVGVDNSLGNDEPSLVYELDAHGRLVTSFGSHGAARVLFGGAQLAQLLQLPDGSLVAVGELPRYVNRGRIVFSALDAAGHPDTARSADLARVTQWLPANNKVDGVAYVDRFGGLGIVGWGVTEPAWSTSGSPMPKYGRPSFGFHVELGPEGQTEGPGSRELVPPPPSLETYYQEGLPSGATLLEVPLAGGGVALADNPQVHGVTSVLELHALRRSGAIGSPYGTMGMRKVRVGFLSAGEAVFPGPRGLVIVLDAQPGGIEFHQVSIG